jgi:hypothetical protein
VISEGIRPPRPRDARVLSGAVSRRRSAWASAKPPTRGDDHGKTETPYRQHPLDAEKHSTCAPVQEYGGAARVWNAGGSILWLLASNRSCPVVLTSLPRSGSTFMVFEALVDSAISGPLASGCPVRPKRAQGPIGFRMPAHRKRVRQDGPAVYRQCPDCRTRTAVFVTPAAANNGIPVATRKRHC